MVSVIPRIHCLPLSKLRVIIQADREVKNAIVEIILCRSIFGVGQWLKIKLFTGKIFRSMVY